MRCHRPFDRWRIAIATVLCLVAPAAAQESDSERIRLLNHPEQGELVLEIGPIELPAGVGHHEILQLPLLTTTIPIDAYLYGFEVQMVDGEGAPITNRLLHHVNLIDPDHRELFTPTARRLFAAGQDTPPGRVPKIIGLPLDRGQRLMVTSMFHNPTDRSYPEARLRVTLLYRDKGWFFPFEVYPFYVDVMGPVGGKDFDLPPGRYERSWEGSPAIAGRILAIGGHLHKYAEVLRFEDLTTGEVIWEGRPVMDSIGRVIETPLGHLWKQGGVRIQSDHIYRLTSIYENPTGDTIPEGGMGALGGLFLPAGGEWPAVDPENPVYAADLGLTFQTAYRRANGLMEMEKGHGAHHDH